MLFTSGLRKAVDAYDPNAAAIAETADHTARILAEKRKRMIRRHTCSTLKPTTDISLSPNRFRAAKAAEAIAEDLEPPNEPFQPRKISHPNSISPPMPPPAVAPPAPPPMPPMMAAKPMISAPISSNRGGFTDDWGTTSFTPSAPSAPSYNSQSQLSHPPSLIGAGSASQIGDDFDDEWTDEEEPDDTNSHVTHVPTRRDNQSVVSRSASAGAAGGKANRNINRFSNFVKSGMEAYVLGDTKMNGQPGERHDIITSGNMVQWRPIQQYYTCVVDKPKKESKMKGLKSFIAYTITSSLRGIQVSRRYKHFDWLHERLSAKYCLIPIPPLPEKQVSGRYEEDLIDHRKHILQLWVNKICRHPVLSQSEVWLHFITCTDEKDWKNGKRRAEKDEYIGGNFLHCVTFPSGHLDNNNVEKQVEKFQRSVKCTEDAMRTMQERLQVFQKLYQGPVKSNWQKMALSFSTMGQAFNTDEHPAANKMKDALNHTAHQYHQIGEDFDIHTRNDMEPVVENLYSFKGTVQAVPDILNVHKQCVQKLRENEGKVSLSDAERIRQRVDTTSYAVMAEMNHLNAEKIEDFRVTMSTYLKKQAEFYQKVANNFAELARHYDF